MSKWQPIETAPKANDEIESSRWIIGYTSWGQQVGKFHEWVGPCEWYGEKLGWEFRNIDFDVFPGPTHWMPLPEPPEGVR